MICKMCGSEIDPKDSFCFLCGFKNSFPLNQSLKDKYGKEKNDLFNGIPHTLTLRKNSKEYLFSDYNRDIRPLEEILDRETSNQEEEFKPNPGKSPRNKTFFLSILIFLTLMGGYGSGVLFFSNPGEEVPYIPLFDDENQTSTIKETNNNSPEHINATNIPENCNYCDGKGYIICPDCRGSGFLNCIQCKGSGVIRDNQTCPSCSGSGKSICLRCKCSGEIKCPRCA